MESNNHTLKEVGRACTAIHHASSDTALRIQSAIQVISTEQLAAKICASLTGSTLKPLQAALANVSAASEQMEKSSANAQRCLELWRKVNIGGVIAFALLATAILSSSAILVIQTEIRDHYQQQLATEVQRLQAKQARAGYR